MNESSSPVVISQLSFSGGPFSATSADTLPINIPSGGSRTLMIGFTPITTDDYSGQLTLMNASATPIAQIPIQGQGALNGNLSLSTLNLSFGSVTVNSATTQLLTLTSTGTSTVTVNTASITGAGFSIVAGSFPITLNPSQSVTLQVQFLPTSAGAVAGQLTISSNSTSGSMAIVALNGTAVAANPQLTVNTPSLNFGSVTVATSTTQSVTLTSTGTSAVTVNSMSISGGGFSVLGGSFPLTLNPTQIATLQIQFLPTSAGAVAGQLTISSNSTSGSMATVALSGTGAEGTHWVDLSWNAPSGSTDPVVGYNIYRSISSSGPFLLINSTPDAQTTYVDNAVVSGSTYNYYAKSVDASGIESTQSNEISVTIP